jgi:2-polyprenyl-3-methyl-5-hydroxy-6-metoxy-1,4-benzoquinol methylase
METQNNKRNQNYGLAEYDSFHIAEVLTENTFLLPETGTALDLACGLGGNAVFLAQQGLAVTAWDISSLAIEKLTAYAAHHDLDINACEKNITNKSLPKSSYDVISVSRFLDRSLSDAIIDALKPGGLLFYQTFTREKTNGSGPNNPRFLLSRNELLRLFSPLTVVYYRENRECGNIQKGLRNEAQYIGQNTN